MSDSVPRGVVPYLNEIAKRLWSDSAAVMVGAGFSQNAESVGSAPETFPDWKSLGDLFYRELHGEPPGEGARYLSPPNLAEQVEIKSDRQNLNRMLREAIPDLQFKPSELHSKLLSLPWKDVFTTNYDTLLERALAYVTTQDYHVVTTKEDLPQATGRRIVKLHGSFPSPPFVITEEDYRVYPETHAPFVNTFRQALLEKTLCLIGFSGIDPNFQQWVGWLRDNFLEDTAPRVYMVGVFESLSEADRDFQLGRSIVPVDLSGFNKNPKIALKYFLEYLERHRAAAPRSSGIAPDAQSRQYEADPENSRQGELLEERQRSALYDVGSELIERYNTMSSGARFIRMAKSGPRIEPANKPFFEIPESDANHAERLAKETFDNERLGVFPLEGNGIRWEDDPLTVLYQSVAYSDVLALREANIRHNAISCNLLMIANDLGAIVLNRRSGLVGTHKGMLQIFGGGMVVGGPNVSREPDPDCWSAARREVREELKIDLPADLPPNTYPIYIGEDVESGYLQISYLGVPISEAQLTAAQTNWEGKLALIHFEDLESRLGQPEDFVPSGLMHIKVWLSLGAPGVAAAHHLRTLRRIEPWTP